MARTHATSPSTRAKKTRACGPASLACAPRRTSTPSPPSLLRSRAHGRMKPRQEPTAGLAAAASHCGVYDSPARARWQGGVVRWLEGRGRRTHEVRTHRDGRRAPVVWWRGRARRHVNVVGVPSLTSHGPDGREEPKRPPDRHSHRQIRTTACRDRHETRQGSGSQRQRATAESAWPCSHHGC
jgi:hypothetical protein